MSDKVEKPDFENEEKARLAFISWYNLNVDDELSETWIDVIFDYFKRYHVEPLQSELKQKNFEAAELLASFTDKQKEATKLFQNAAELQFELYNLRKERDVWKSEYDRISGVLKREYDEQKILTERVGELIQEIDRPVIERDQFAIGFACWLVEEDHRITDVVNWPNTLIYQYKKTLNLHNQ